MIAAVPRFWCSSGSDNELLPRPGLFLLFLTVVGCGDRDPGDVAHTDTTTAPPRDTAVISTDSIPAGLTEDALRRWRTARDVLVGAMPMVGIGDYEKGPAVFGEISDAKIDAAGNILVLDGQAARLSVFDSRGGPMGSFGGAGEGPEELREPRYFALLGEGRVAVPIPGRIKIFRHKEGRWELDETLELSMVANHACSTTEDRLFVSAWQEVNNTVVHEIAGAGVLSSFGTGYPSDDWLLQMALSDGRVACVGRPSRLAHAFTHTSQVRLFSPDGSLLWVAVLADHTPIEITSTTGSVSMRIPEEYDILASIHGMSTGHIVLQYSHRRAGIDSHLRTYVVDAATGGGALISNDLPSIKFIGQERYIATFSDPYPRLEVRVMEWREPAGRRQS